MSDSMPSKESFSWPTSKGDPIGPVWSYGGKKGMYQAEALRAFAHDLVDRIKEFELPVREAMKAASGDGLDAFAYCRMLQRRLDGKQREIERLQRQVDALSVHASKWVTRALQLQQRARHEPPVAPMSHHELTALCKRFVVEGYNGDYLEDDGFHLAREVEGLTLNRCGAAQPPPAGLRDVAAKIIETARAVDGHANHVLVSRELMGKLVHAWELPCSPQPPAPEWQPIETAPKTGRAIMLVHGSYVTEGYCNHEGEFVCSVIGKPSAPFTHWMPMPTPPPYSASTKPAAPWCEACQGEHVPGDPGWCGQPKRACTCGVPDQRGITHRSDGPCYVTSQGEGGSRNGA